MKKVITLSLIFFILFISLSSIAKYRSVNNGKGELSYKSANLYFGKRDYSKAIKLYKRALLENHENNDIYYKLSICYKEVKKYIESMHCITKAILLLESKVDRLNI